MSTKRERQQLAKRSRRARRRGKPAQPSPKPAPQPPDQSPEPLWPPEDVLIGYIAHEGYEALCHDGAPWIAGDRRQMERNLQQRGRTAMTIQPITFEEIAVALMEGVPLCFDECALARFYEPAQQAGIPIENLARRRDEREAHCSGEPALRLQLDFGSR